jgi:AcrR family transcriptional regulator
MLSHVVAGARERARVAVVAAIKAAARRHLAQEGAAGLSLRAVARELDMVSSAIYRYFASRDELLTALIVDGYSDLATAAERAVARAGTDPREVWRAACRAIRDWARRHPHEYALLYGSPVPGYAAPPDTIDPATRVYAALAAGLRLAGPRPPTPAPVATVARDAEAVAEALGLEVDAGRVVRLLAASTQLFGLVSFELFGHTKGVVSDHDAFFADRVDAMADDLAL